MTITVQARIPGGEWGTRNTFLRSPGALAQAQHLADMWRTNYPDGCEIRVFNSEDRPKTGGVEYEAITSKGNFARPEEILGAGRRDASGL
jgi:hypothetical protein